MKQTAAACLPAITVILSPVSESSGLSGTMPPWMPWALGVTAGILGAAMLVALVRMVGAIDYRIGPKSVFITLFGIPVRRVRLDNIRHISSRRGGFCESWANVLFVKRDRILIIEKRRGVFKRLMITPVQRYVFKAALDRAIREFNGLPENQRNWAAVTPAPPRSQAEEGQANASPAGEGASGQEAPR
jgi:hypothetical protein